MWEELMWKYELWPEEAPEVIARARKEGLIVIFPKERDFFIAPLKWGLARRASILINYRRYQFKTVSYGESSSHEKTLLVEVGNRYSAVSGVFTPKGASLSGEAEYTAKRGMRGVGRIIEKILIRETKMGKQNSGIPTIREILTEIGKEKGEITFNIEFDDRGRIKHVKIDIEGKTIEWEEETDSV
ncbi:protein of unknown function (plasmid) [Thermococcus nautili]|nr:protein of unknown function [Thermococcus nautili]